MADFACVGSLKNRFFLFFDKYGEWDADSFFDRRKCRDVCVQRPEFLPTPITPKASSNIS